jgi:hypothetical protein
MEAQVSETSSTLRKVIFFLQLPEPIGIGIGSTITVTLDKPLPELAGLPVKILDKLPFVDQKKTGYHFVSFRFWQIPVHVDLAIAEALKVVSRAIPQNVVTLKSELPPIDTYCTVVEAVASFTTRRCPR